MIEIRFTADTVADLHRQMHELLFGTDVPEIVKEPLAEAAPPQTTTKAAPAKKPAKAKPVSVPVGEPDDSFTLEEPLPHPDLIEKDDAALVGGVKQDTVAMEALKNQQLDRLRDLFSAGKVKFVRELLAQHGGGAKVFPEVDVLAFPAIKKAIDKEMGLQ